MKFNLFLFFVRRISNGRIAFIMEGGYSSKGIKECGLRVMQELCDVPTLTRKKIDKIMGNSAMKISRVKKVIEIQKKYWKILI